MQQKEQSQQPQLEYLQILKQQEQKNKKKKIKRALPKSFVTQDYPQSVREWYEENVRKKTGSCKYGGNLINKQMQERWKKAELLKQQENRNNGEQKNWTWLCIGELTKLYAKDWTELEKWMKHGSNDSKEKKAILKWEMKNGQQHIFMLIVWNKCSLKGWVLPK